MPGLDEKLQSATSSGPSVVAPMVENPIGPQWVTVVAEAQSSFEGTGQVDQLTLRRPWPVAPANPPTRTRYDCPKFAANVSDEPRSFSGELHESSSQATWV